MRTTVSQKISECVTQASQLYYRLVIVVGPVSSGKTVALGDLEAENGWPLVNLNLSLSKQLLELTTRQRALRVARLVDNIVNETSASTVLLDNIEMLFHPDLKQDPLRLLQSLSRNRTIVTAWRGVHQGRSLVYASPEHPEYRLFDDPQALIVSAQEHSA